MVSIPILGYPSKKAAIRALLDEGVDHKEIARRCDTSEQIVYVSASDYRNEKKRNKADAERRAALEPTPITPGWNPAKVEKARRIFANAMVVIAEALNVPVRELVKLVCDDVLPPMAPEPSAEIEQLPLGSTPALALRSLAKPLPTPAPKALPAPPDESETLADDEPDEEPEPAPAFVPSKPRPIPVNGRCHMVAPSGEYLHLTCEAVTRDKSYAWIGTPMQALAVRRKWPETSTYKLVKMEAN